MIVTNFHAFTDGKDEFVNTFDEAKAIIDKWRKDCHTNLAINKEQSDNTKDDFVEQETVYLEGDFPE